MRASPGRIRRVAFPRSAGSGIGICVAAALILSACGSGDYTYAGSSRLRTAFRVPAGWTAISGRQLGQALQFDKDPTFATDYPFMEGFDAAPNPSLLDLVASQSAAYPVVLAWVRKMNFGEHDQTSLRSLRNAYYEVDRAEDAGQGHTLSYSSFTLPGGYWGNRLTFLVRGTTPTSPQLQFSQIAATDAHLQYQYVLIVQCSPDCFQRDKGAIEDILHSWRLKG